MGVECDQVGREETEGRYLSFDTSGFFKLLVVPASAAKTLRRAPSAGHRGSGRGTLQQWQNLRRGIRGNNGNLGKVLDECALQDILVPVALLDGLAGNFDHDRAIVAVISVRREEHGGCV